MLPEDVGGPGDLAKYRLEVAKEDLTAAERNLEDGLYRAANNRAYYSIYRSITAVLALEGVAYKKHKDTIAHFNVHYVKTEIFPREFGRKIGEAQRIRHKSDYDEFYIASIEKTREQVETAREAIHRVEEYIRSKSDDSVSNTITNSD